MLLLEVLVACSAVRIAERSGSSSIDAIARVYCFPGSDGPKGDIHVTYKMRSGVLLDLLEIHVSQHVIRHCPKHRPTLNSCRTGGYDIHKKRGARHIGRDPRRGATIHLTVDSQSSTCEPSPAVQE